MRKYPEVSPRMRLSCSSDDAVSWVTASTTLLVRGDLSRTFVLEDDTVSGITTSSSTLVVGRDGGGGKGNALERIHVEFAGLSSSCH